MRLLILGYSDFSKRRIIPIILKKFKNIKLGIASISRFKKDEIKNVAWFDNYKKSIKNFNPDIVYISLPNSIHFKWAEYLLKKKINIIVDKPICLGIENSKKLIKLSKKFNLLIAEATIFDYHKQIEKGIQLAGGIKKIKHISSFFCIPKPEKGNIKLSPKYGGGCLYDMGSYAAGIYRVFLKKIPKKIFVSFIKKNKLIEKFNISSSDKCSVNGFFSHNDHYMNEINLFTNKRRVSIKRAFSPDPSQDCNIDFFYKNKHNKIKVKKESTFEKFFKEILKTMKSKSFNNFHKKIEFDMKIVNKIQNEIKKKH